MCCTKNVMLKLLRHVSCFVLNLSHSCRLISDLVVVIVSAAIGGIIFSCLGQPVSTAFFFSYFSFLNSRSNLLHSSLPTVCTVVLQTCWIMC